MKNNDTPTKPKLHREARREAILHGAARAFVQSGYEVTSLDDVARAAGISRTLLYRHFDSKKELYATILDGVRIRLREVVGSEPTPTLAGRVHGLIRVAQADPDGFRLFYRYAAYEPEFQAYVQQSDSQRTKVTDEMSRFVANSVDSTLALQLVHNTFIEMVITWIDNGMPSPEKMADLLQSIAKDILGSLGGPA